MDTILDEATTTEEDDDDLDRPTTAPATKCHTASSTLSASKSRFGRNSVRPVSTNTSTSLDRSSGEAMRLSSRPKTKELVDDATPERSTAPIPKGLSFNPQERETAVDEDIIAPSSLSGMGSRRMKHKPAESDSSMAAPRGRDDGPSKLASVDEIPRFLV